MSEALFGARPLDFGVLLSRSFAHLWLIRREMLVYLALIAVAAFALPLVMTRTSSAPGLVAYLAGQYWLFRTLLERLGLLETKGNHLLAFGGLALLLAIPIALGLVLLLLPGLFLVARWIAAPAFVAGRGEGPIAAARSSWQAVRGHTGKAAGAVVLMFVIASAATLASDAAGALLPDIAAYRRSKPLDALAVQVFPILLLGLSTATYALLGPEGTLIEEVFG